MINSNEVWLICLVLSYQWLKKWKGLQSQVLNEIRGLESTVYGTR